ncbi:DgyrCDS12889 [Dimorphilus gyrociliatus]|uniref:DgyrCDS12889 n=1 Tax=Dimorphilus gyrociliatus TaxID=2664684 RepID=A0A7I8W927_9ANNE|nr:DgyrCDS12889 [Dimorphilus gyrociliatus]
MSKVIPVKVALRCRPLGQKEILEGCANCIDFACDEPQVILGGHKSFTYDYAFPAHMGQDTIYQEAVAPLVEGIFDGYNATVLAYGQTGSGKTHTMSGSDHSPVEENKEGVIQKVIYDLFEGFRERTDFNYTTKVTYLELYNENFRDLLVNSDDQRETIQVREDPRGGIMATGLHEMVVTTAEETLASFKVGVGHRSTGATAMNLTSSRSHAVFTIYISRTRADDVDDICHAKFHLVDLAGSERQKKTRAEGERLKEGININMGLHILGNVIAALSGENGKKARYVPYRDSKLTRLLQDSLGGNSQTLMIACISPADSNYDETHSTLQYADRARKITNKAKVNRDPIQAELFRLRQLLQEKERQLALCTCGAASTTAVVHESSTGITPAVSKKIEKLEGERDNLLNELTQATEISATLQEKVIQYEMVLEHYQSKIGHLKERTSRSIGTIKPEVISEKEEAISSTTTEIEETTENRSNHTFLHSLVQDLDELTNIDPEKLRDTQSHTPETSDDEEDHDQDKKDLTCTAFTLRRARMNKDIEELTGKLAAKQKLIKDMTENGNKISELKEHYEHEIKRLENELDQQKKKLDEVKYAEKNSKVAETHRKRCKELEQKIGDLRKKMADKDRLLKMTKARQEEINKIQSEMISLKRTRVRLLKQMKEESTEYQRMMQMKDKEIMQFKAQQRKRAAEMAKESKVKDKRLAVLKRKAEEYQAVNKRLQEAMEKQKQALDERNNHQAKADAGGIGQRTRKYIKREFQLILSIEEAREALSQEMRERKHLNEELTKLKSRLDPSGPPLKRQMLTMYKQKDSSNLELREKIKQMENEVMTKNAFIQELQRKISDAEKSGDKMNKWDGIKSIVEAKCALRWFADTALSTKIDLKKKTKLLEEARKEIESNFSEIQELKDLHQKDMERLRRDNENNVLACLQLGTCSVETQTKDKSYEHRLSAHEEKLRQLSSVYEELDALREENEKYRQRIEGQYIKMETDGQSEAALNSTFSIDTINMEEKQITECDRHNTTFCHPVSPSKKAVKRSSSTDSDGTLDNYTCLESDEENRVPSPAKSTDPNWTPVSQGNLKRRLTVSREKPQNNNISNPVAICKCKTSCTKNCGCKKNNVACTERCKCSTFCLNKETSRNIEEEKLYDENYASPGGLMSGKRKTVNQSFFPAIPT